MTDDARRGTARPSGGTPAPDALELAWGVQQPARAGRRPTLSIAKIVGAAVELADAQGLAACSMPKLAEHLGVGTMSLYRYLSAKSDLLLLMRDAATGPVPEPSRAGGHWRDVLTHYAIETAARYARRPWLLDVPVQGFPQTPNLLSWLELGLAALEGTGLDDQQRLGSMLLLDGHVNATARLARAGATAETTPSEPPVALMDLARYPALARLVTDGALREDAFADYGLQFGIDRILGSIEQLMTGQATGRRR